MNTNEVADTDEVSFAGRPPIETSESAVNGVCLLVDRVAGVSLQQLDNMINELQELRLFLMSEGERLQRELADYGKLTRATLRSSRMVRRLAELAI